MKPEPLMELVRELDGVADEFEPMHFEIHPLRWYRISAALKAAAKWLEAAGDFEEQAARKELRALLEGK